MYRGDAQDSAATEEYLIQVEAFSDKELAIESVQRLKEMDYHAYITESHVDGKTWYRVQIGGFSDRAAAQTTRDALSDEGISEPFIIKATHE